MSRRRPRASRAPRSRKLLGTFLVLVVANAVMVLTATNSVPITRADNEVSGVNANDLKPEECAALDLTNVEGGSVAVTGTDANDLLLGSELLDAIDGRAGDDCLVGGPGDDTLDGGPGTDVCLGDAGVDVFLNCETEIQ